MFQYDIASVKHYTSKKDKQSAYSQFLMQIGERESQYPFSLECEKLYKGKPTVFTVQSWGGYYNADQQWTLFVAYRCEHPKHTIQHTWFWDEANQSCFNHRVLEFIN